MSAVLGNKREHHFRHKGDTCSYESYLHKIAKLLVAKKFDESKSFVVEYPISRFCEKIDCPLRSKQCENNQKRLSKIDLRKEYDKCEVEGIYNGFRADVMLSSSDNPDKLPLFLEIFVSHECSKEKIDSGIPIIEVSIKSEDEIDNYLNGFPDDGIKFYNFNKPLQKPISRFFVAKCNDGLLRGRIERNIGTCYHDLLKKREDSIFEFRFFDDELSPQQTPLIWKFGMVEALQKGYQCKDCRICSNFETCDLYYLIQIKVIDFKVIDSVNQACRCKKFNIEKYYIQILRNHFKKLKYV